MVFFFVFFFLLPPPRFPDDNFWQRSRTAPEFKPVTGHGHRKKCIVFRPRTTPGWGRGAPQTPQNPPSPPQKKCSRTIYNHGLYITMVQQGTCIYMHTTLWDNTNSPHYWLSHAVTNILTGVVCIYVSVCVCVCESPPLINSSLTGYLAFQV